MGDGASTTDSSLLRVYESRRTFGGNGGKEIDVARVSSSTSQI